jgi:hypothetical protein
MERMKMSISKTIKTKPLDIQKTNITYSHVMEALGPKRKDLDEKQNGKDVPLITKSKKHGYMWAPQYVSFIFKEELLHGYNKRTQQVVGGRRTPKFKKIKKKMVS